MHSLPSFVGLYEVRSKNVRYFKLLQTVSTYLSITILEVGSRRGLVSSVSAY